MRPVIVAAPGIIEYEYEYACGVSMISEPLQQGMQPPSRSDRVDVQSRVAGYREGALKRVEGYVLDLLVHAHLRVSVPSGDRDGLDHVASIRPLGRLATVSMGWKAAFAAENIRAFSAVRLSRNCLALWRQLSESDCDAFHGLDYELVAAVARVQAGNETG